MTFCRLPVQEMVSRFFEVTRYNAIVTRYGRVTLPKKKFIERSRWRRVTKYSRYAFSRFFSQRSRNGTLPNTPVPFPTLQTSATVHEIIFGLIVRFLASNSRPYALWFTYLNGSTFFTPKFFYTEIFLQQFLHQFFTTFFFPKF